MKKFLRSAPAFLMLIILPLLACMHNPSVESYITITVSINGMSTGTYVGEYAYAKSMTTNAVYALKRKTSVGTPVFESSVPLPPGEDKDNFEIIFCGEYNGNPVKGTSLESANSADLVAFVSYQSGECDNIE